MLDVKKYDAAIDAVSDMLRRYAEEGDCSAVEVGGSALAKLVTARGVLIGSNPFLFADDED